MANKKVSWGVLGAARIATNKVIPAMQKGEFSEISGLASRTLEKAQEAAGNLGIPKAYGSYEELLADPDIDAVYNPLPNHLHVPLSIQAAEAGKHVLCEKPIALSAKEAQQLIDARDRFGVNITEAFMVRHHPQWLKARELVNSGQIGDLRVINWFVSYFNEDPSNIRNKPEWGGGSLMDIGVYPIVTSRFITGQEPLRVVGLLERHPEWGIDCVTSALLDFPSVQATFTCATQVFGYQRAQLFGTKGRIEIEIPCNAPSDTACKMFLENDPEPHGQSVEVQTFPVTDQYTLQGDAFSRSVLEKDFSLAGPPIEDAVCNMKVVDAIFESAESGAWVGLD